MNDHFNTLFDHVKGESLGDSEKARMRNELSLFMSEHPARAPFSIRFLDWLGALGDRMTGAQLPHVRFASAALVLVLFVGVGTSYAAERALPGDPLYAVKIYVNEPVRGSLAVSAPSKAQWSAEVITRRLEEAETLASEDRLTPAARSQIEVQVNDAAHDFDTSVSQVAQADDQAQVAMIQSNLEASLEGHAQVLAMLTADAPQTTKSLAPILAAVRAKAEQAESAREHSEDHLAVAGHADLKTAAAASKVSAQRAVGTVRTLATASKKSGSDNADASTSATIAEYSLQDGDKKFASGDYARAFSAFQSAIRTAQSTQINIEVGERLKAAIAATSSTSTDPTSAASSTATSTATTTIPIDQDDHERDGH
jgi:hypothetical protein